jgi:predicted small metal-binding protein
MRKRIRCGALVPGCAFVAHGNDDAEAVRQLTDHVRAAHDMDRMSRPLQEKLHRAIETLEPTRTQA